MDTTKETQLPSREQHSLPPVSELFSESWQSFKKTWWKILLLFLPFFGIGLLFALVVVIVTIAVGVTSAETLKQVSEVGVSALDKVPPQMWLVVGVLVLISLIAFGLLSLALSAATLLVVDKRAENPGIGSLLGKGFSFSLPLVVMGLITCFLSIGGFVLFIIPGILISFYLSFALYEIVLENAKPLNALRGSISMVQQHFFEILGRLGIMWLIQIGLSMIFSILTNPKNDGHSFFTLIETLVNVGLSIFTISFGVILYRQVKSHSENRLASLKGVLIVGLLGWILLVVGIVSYGQLIVRNIQDIQQQQAALRNPADDTNTLPTPITRAHLLNDDEATGLAQQVFIGFNEARTAQNLAAVPEDQRLCAYAQRRIQQLEDFGSYDDDKGFFEDLQDTKITQTYFSNYARLMNPINEQKNGYATAEAFVKGFSQPYTQAEGSFLTDPKLTGMCIRANQDFFVTVAGLKK